MELVPQLLAHTKVNSRWTWEVNVKGKTINFIDARRVSHELGIGNFFEVKQNIFNNKEQVWYVQLH